MASEEKTDVEYQDQIQEIRKNVKELTTKVLSDNYIMRWIKAADYDMERAEILMKKRLRGEQMIQIDRITKDYKMPEIMKTYDFLSFMGFDKDNDPIFYMNVTNRDEEGLLRTFSSIDIALHYVYWKERIMEYQMDHCKKLGIEPNEVITVVADYENYTLQHATDKMAIYFAMYEIKLIEDMDPGLIKRTIIINATATFSALFSVIKAFASADMIENTITCSVESTTEELLKYIDADVLPASLGGSKIDDNGDPKCSAFLNYGGKIPEEYYSINRPQLEFSDEGVVEITVPAWNSNDVLVYVEKPGSKIHVEFKSYEVIGFEVLIRKIKSSEEDILEDLDEPEEIFGPVDVYSHLTPIDYMCHAPTTAIYVFRFDNTGSWVESKCVLYRIRVIPPETDE